MELDTIACMDALTYLKSLPDESVNCVVTSPPYFGLRDYGVDGQIGNEQTPAEYVARMVELFCEVQRVLKPDGTAWLNLGDSYYSGRGESQGKDPKSNQRRFGVRALDKGGGLGEGLKPKNLIGIPWRVAFALQDSGWILRSEIIWNKPNCLPESVRDRPTKAHETIFLLVKQSRYYYDAEVISEPSTHAGKKVTLGDKSLSRGQALGAGVPMSGNALASHVTVKPTRNKRSVWTVPLKPLKEKHYAAFPKRLAETMILAGCPKGSVVLDPFMGSGTTALVARHQGRHYLGCDLNPEYVAIANKRLGQPYTPALL